MAIQVSFAELTHTGKSIAADFMPLGIASIASYLKQEMGDAVAVELFKYTSDFATYLDRATPSIAAFANYSWCESLNHEFARRIKARHPQVVTVFGGPNYPAGADEQADFLRHHSSIDFYVDGEGELAFIELFKVLRQYDFDVEAIKRAGLEIPNTQYLYQGRFVTGTLLPRVAELDHLPSPFTTGMMDKFFDEYLTPLMQTSRGCPYSCSFCHDGIGYMSKLKRYSMGRIKADISYIQARRKVPNLGIADLNFGIFKEDEEVADFIAGIREECGWPNYVSVSTAKSNKDRVVRMTLKLKGALTAGASVQSTNAEVLKLIKRSNISVETLAEMTKEVATDGVTSLSEIILCLPGDSKQRHIQSVLDMIDIGIQEIRLFQFIILPGSDGASRASREQFGYVGRFRVPPLSIGRYEVYGEKFVVAEMHEICVGNDTMPHDDYLECRKFDLVVSIFNNGGVFNELYRFVESRGIKRSELLLAVWEQARSRPSALIRRIFQGFEDDERINFWDDADAFREQLNKPETIDKYISGELGTNQVLHFRAEAMVEQFDEVCSLIFDVARSLLRNRNDLAAPVELYLSELATYITLRKGNLFAVEMAETREFHFNFIKLAELGFRANPMEYAVPQGLHLRISHNGVQRRDIEQYTAQYGKSVDGFERFLNRTIMGGLYRDVVYAG